MDDVARLHRSPFSIPGFRSSFIPYRSRRGSKAVVLVILDAHVDLNHRSTRRSAQADADFVAPAQSIECMFVTVRNVFSLLCDDLPGIEAYGVGQWGESIRVRRAKEYLETCGQSNSPQTSSEVISDRRAGTQDVEFCRLICRADVLLFS